MKDRLFAFDLFTHSNLKLRKDHFTSAVKVSTPVVIQNAIQCTHFPLCLICGVETQLCLCPIETQPHCWLNPEPIWSRKHPGNPTTIKVVAENNNSFICGTFKTTANIYHKVSLNVLAPIPCPRNGENMTCWKCWTKWCACFTLSCESV